MAAWLARASSSELVAAEATQWRAGGGFGAGMLVAFVGAQLLEGSSRSELAGYVDPGLVLVAAVVFVVPPMGMVRTMLRELLEAAPDDAVQDRVRPAIETVSVAHGLDAPTVRMAKVGTKLYIDAEYLTEPDRTIAETDDVRRALARALADLDLDAWLTVEFSADPTWDEPRPGA